MGSYTMLHMAGSNTAASFAITFMPAYLNLSCCSAETLLHTSQHVSQDAPVAIPEGTFNALDGFFFFFIEELL